MLDEAEGTQLEQKNSTIKTPFNKEFLKSYSGTHIHILLITCTKKINQGKCQNATKG